MPRVARASRTAGQRGYQSRKMEARETILPENRNILWYDKRLQPAGMEYAWIRRAVRNEEDSLNVRSQQMNGWKTVPPDRHPELSVGGWGLASETVKSYIEIGGLILCECPSREFNRRKMLQDQAARDSVKMKHIEGDPNARNLPTYVNPDSGTRFERRVTEGDPRFPVKGNGSFEEEEFQEDR